MIVWKVDKSLLQDLRLLTGMCIPMGAGMMVYGWRGVLTMMLVVAGSVMAREALRGLTIWPVSIRRLNLVSESLLVGIFLPAGLFDVDQSMLSTSARWPFALTAGVLLVLLKWVIERIGTTRLSPVVLTVLILAALIPRVSSDDRVLSPQFILRGDLLGTSVTERSVSTADPWFLNRSGDVVLQTSRAAERIQDYLQAHVSSDRHVRTLTQLVSDELPPLEDLVILGQPSTIGQASGIGLLIGGLFLVHRRMMPFRIPVMMLMVLAVLLLILPTPIVIGSDQTVSRWLAARDGRVGWAVGLTFVNYLLFASSSLAVFFFLASRPGVRPLGRHSSMVYAILIGTLSAVLIRFVSVEWGPLMAVAMIQPLTPWLDRRIVSRPI
ncbi:MAG: hypothetical protein KatS3mg104_1875 [Phycisphaerae bacterium]|nr:MAG: hypothetical protein KatS3mg104_1875 [Phycisphaerae bacterium]